MAYNLPPPWDPGYALPDNVRDEGLERKAYVTKWMTRGTYDAPNVGSGGYVLPPNVQAEGYGQGTFTTKWLPRGYYDDTVPHALNRRPQRTATRQIGPRTRAVSFKAPVTVAPYLEGGAVALNDAELHPVFTQYGERAADILLRSVAGMPQQQAKAKLKALMDRIDPTLWGRCAQLTRQYMDQGFQGMGALRAGLATAMSAGIAAEIVRAGLSREKPQARSLLGLGCYGCVAALGATTVQTAFRPPADRYVVGSGAVTSGPDDVLQVGPWSFPTTPDVRITIPASSLNANNKALAGVFANAMAKAAAAILMTKAASHSPMGLLPSDTVRLETTGLGSGMVPIEFVGSGMPLWKFVHPTIGKTMVVVAKSVGTKAAPAIQLWWHEDPGLVSSLLNALVTLIATIVKGVLDAVSTVACDLLGNPAITLAAAGAAVAAGAPPQAGVTGASIAQNACGTPPPPPPILSAESGSILLPVAIVGGAALVAVLLTRKKKAVTP